MSLRRQVGLGLFWLTVASIASRGLGLLRKLVLARLLVPGDFGLVGYASLIIGILGLFTEMGFSSALIYRQDDVDEAANTIFILIIASSVLLYGLAWVSAPWVAGFFRNAALVSVLRVLSISLVISSVSQVPLTLMARGMGFKAKVLPEIAGGLVGSSISVALALMGHGVWAIIYGQLITSLIISILVWFFCPWRPRLRLDLRLLRQLWDYGRHIVGSQVMVFLITNVDDAFVGRFKGDEGLGLYSLAYDLSNLPATHLSRIVG
ncbi:MAG: oligosaccharide flippase family protein, partial [Chloroflexota bacterium]